jgi:SARP family transcriptional regulator, regulator of embCAB operon
MHQHQHQQDEIRIQLLGALQVHRSDGTAVNIAEWRTGKTMDLLRLLALDHDRPVRPAGLIEKLWPGVPTDRARNSLRTAASQIRRTLRAQCVLRQPDGLVLKNARVDAVDFLDAARGAHVAAREGRFETVLNLTRRAERLYQAPFQAYDDDSVWAKTERDHLEHARQQLLCDGAVAAVEIGLFHEARDLAAVAVELDRSSETAHRALMHAHAELGEVGSALRVFESYRAQLAEELGADPSPQTRELHLRLLRGASA